MQVQKDIYYQLLTLVNWLQLTYLLFIIYQYFALLMKSHYKRQVVQITLTKKNQTTSQNLKQNYLNQNNLSLKQTQNQLKKNVCPKYKLEWTSTPNQQKQNNPKDRNRSRVTSKTALNSIKASMNMIKQSTTDRLQYPEQMQISHSQCLNLLNTRKSSSIYQNFVTQTYDKESQSIQSISSLEMLPIKPSILTLRGTTNKLASNQNMRKRKLSHYQNTHQDKQNNNSNLRASQILNQKQTKQFKLKANEQDSQKVIQTLRKELKMAHEEINTKKTQIQTLKNQIFNLNQRLQQCITQIDQVEKQGAFSRIIQLQTIIEDSTSRLKSTESELKNKIKHLQALNCSYASQIKQSQKQAQSFFTKLQSYESQNKQLKLKVLCFQDQNNLKAKNQRLQEEVSNLYQKIAELSMNQNNLISQKNTVNELESLKFDHEIMKKKYETMQTLLESKKRQIKDKDQVIKMFLQKNKKEETPINAQ